MDVRIFPPETLIEACIPMPQSKSESARALIISAISGSQTTITGLASCDDTSAMQHGLQHSEGTVNVGAAGTAMRFLTAYYAATPGTEITLEGSERMHKRPIGILVEALRQCGADIEYVGEEGYPPLKIRGRQLCGGTIKVDSTVSSQYISALMMVAPTMTRGLQIILEGNVASMPYIKLTAAMMRHAGVDVELLPSSITIPASGYQPCSFVIGGDWSAASYWFEIEALTYGFISLRGLDECSMQGDSSVADLFREFGICPQNSENEERTLDLLPSPDLAPRINYDFSQTPDLVQAAVVAAAMSGIPFKFTGVESLRIKETDRIEALTNELLKVGVNLVFEQPGTIMWDGQRMPLTELPVFDTYDDHRMAMALAPVAVYLPGIVIRNAEVVSKSYPEYFDHLSMAGFLVVDASTPADELNNILQQRSNSN